MKITVCTTNNHMFFLDINEDMDIESLKALCEIETNIVKDQILIIHNGKLLLDSTASLRNNGVKEGDLITVHRIPRDISPTDRSARSVSECQNISSTTSTQLTDDHANSLSPDIELQNPSIFDPILDEQMENYPERQTRSLDVPQTNSFNRESQRLIAEEIRRDNVNDNMRAAIEHNPEAFAVVTMLYVNCKINGACIKAFIDSGAQASLMSASCAEKCNLLRLVDRRWSGIAKGVGEQRILGRIHMAQIQIESDYLLSSFSVLENQQMDVMLGLDVLRKYECIIDLQRNVLRIGSTSTETAFLPESELPDHAKITEVTNIGA